MADNSQTILCECDQQAPAGIWWRIGIGAFLAMNGMVLSLAVNGSEVTLEERAMLELSILCVSASVIVLLAPEFLQATFQNLRERRLGIEFLFLTGIVACLAASILSLTTRTGASYSDVAAMLLVIYALGRQIGSYGKSRVLEQLRQWSPAQRCVRLLDGSTISAAQIRQGDSFRVFPGESIPVDARIVHGRAFVHEATVSGESVPVPRGPADIVAAGTHPIDASLDCMATRDGEASTLDDIRTLVLNGLAIPGREQRLALNMLRWFTPVVLLTALGTFTFHLQYQTWPTATFHALSVLVVACPCALGFATPLAVWTAIARLRELGLSARTGEAVERLAEINTVVFDKTGTLTLPDHYEVSWQVTPAFLTQQPRLRFLLREAEAASNHPLAIALQPLWKDQALDACTTLTQVQLHPGRGLNAHFADETTLTLLSNSQEIEIRINEQLAATITLKEALDPTALPAIQSLAAQDLRTILATGDSPERAAAIPIDEQHSRQSPTNKYDLLRQLHGQGAKTLFVGDGLNDIAAMAWSHVSCTSATSPALVREVGSLILNTPNWRVLPQAIAIARAARRSVRINLIASLAYNVVGMGLAAMGVLSPVAAALIMLFSSLTVVLQSSRLFDWSPE
jgi:cation transport ATPase